MVIVVSILFAFYIDATWDERQAYEEEQTILTTLLVELKGLQEIQVNGANYLPAIRESVRRLLEFGREPKTSINDEQLDAWLADTTWNGRGLRSTTPALDSLTEGGNLYRISDNDLRVQLSLLRQLLELRRADAHREQIFMDEQYFAYLNAHASVGQIWAADDGQPGTPGATLYPSSGPEMRAPPKKVSHRNLVENLEFQNLLIHRILLVNNLMGVGDFASIDDALSATITAIEQELEK